MNTICESIPVISACEGLSKENDTAKWSLSEGQYKSYSN